MCIICTNAEAIIRNQREKVRGIRDIIHSGGILPPLTGIILKWIKGIILSKWIIWIIWGVGLVGPVSDPSDILTNDRAGI